MQITNFKNYLLVVFLSFCLFCCTVNVGGRYLKGDDAGVDSDILVLEKAELAQEGSIEGGFSNCTPGSQCDDGRYCCSKNGVVGCWDNAENCDCSDKEEVCKEPFPVCCEEADGKKLCRADMDGCRCGGPQGFFGVCGSRMMCCVLSGASTGFCTSEPEGCLCDPSGENQCGSGYLCCWKRGEDAHRCHADTVDCRCSNIGLNSMDCGATSPVCCVRYEGETPTCGPSSEGCACSGSGDYICDGLVCCRRDGRNQCVSDPNNCPCNSMEDCGSGYVCCNLFDWELRKKFCRNSAEGCQCSDLPGADCGYLGESLSCYFGFCY